MQYQISIIVKDKFGAMTNIKLESRPHNVNNSVRVQRKLTVTDVDLNMNLQIDRPSPSLLNGSLNFVNTLDGTSTYLKLVEKKLSIDSDTLVEYPDLQLPNALGTISLFITAII
jgi:hypothetical protein